MKVRWFFVLSGISSFTLKGGFEQHRPAVQSGGQKSPCGAFLDARLAISTRAHQKDQRRKYEESLMVVIT